MKLIDSVCSFNNDRDVDYKESAVAVNETASLTITGFGSFN